MNTRKETRTWSYKPLPTLSEQRREYYAYWWRGAIAGAIGAYLLMLVVIRASTPPTPPAVPSYQAHLDRIEHIVNANRHTLIDPQIPDGMLPGITNRSADGKR